MKKDKLTPFFSCEKNELRDKKDAEEAMFKVVKNTLISSNKPRTPVIEIV